MGFTWTFLRNQDATVKSKSELIFIKFQQFFNTLADPKQIFPIQTILLTCKLKKEAKFGQQLSDFCSFRYFQTSLSLGVEQGLQKPQKFDLNDLILLFHCNILIPRKCPRKTSYKAQCPPLGFSDLPTVLITSKLYQLSNFPHAIGPDLSSLRYGVLIDTMGLKKNFQSRIKNPVTL